MTVVACGSSFNHGGRGMWLIQFVMLLKRPKKVATVPTILREYVGYEMSKHPVTDLNFALLSLARETLVHYVRLSDTMSNDSISNRQNWLSIFVHPTEGEAKVDLLDYYYICF